MTTADVLDDVLDLLRCPHCSRSLRRKGAAVRCTRAHSFDVARAGYLSLLAGDARLGSADTAEMVAAREVFLGAGHFEPLADRVADEAARVPAGGCVVDVGAGTGWYLARVLNRLPDRSGLALDLSKHALRRAARAHPRVGAVGCDVWRALPVRDEVAALALDVFAPRNGAELARILRPDGALVVVTPTSRHLGELVSALGLVGVDARKDERLGEQLGPYFELAQASELAWPLRLTHADALAAALMGPSAAHTSSADMRPRIAALPDPVPVTAAVTISVFRRRSSPDR